MKFVYACLGLVCCFFVSIGSPAESYAQSLELTEKPGGSVKTSLGFGIAINKKSSLERRWFTINDPASPVQLEDAGLNTVFGERSYSFVPEGDLKVREDIAALEVRFILFDLWNGHLKTLSGIEVIDLTAGDSIAIEEVGKWRAWESEVSTFLKSVAFVARVRATDGTVWVADLNAVYQKISEGDFEMGKESLEPPSPDDSDS